MTRALIKPLVWTRLRNLLFCNTWSHRGPEKVEGVQVGDIEQHFLRKSLKFIVTNLPIKFLKPANAHLQKQTAEDKAHLGRDPEIRVSVVKVWGKGAFAAASGLLLRKTKVV